MDEQAFHEKMRGMYNSQPPLFDRKDGNDHIVQAKLPADIYVPFYQFLKEKGMTRSQGVQFAIYKLINGKP